MENKICSKVGVMDLLSPPECVRAMKTLNREAFKKTIRVTYLDVEKVQMAHVNEPLKKYFLKFSNMKPVHIGTKNRLFLNPLIVRSFEDFPADICGLLDSLNIGSQAFGEHDITLTYANYNASSVLKAILPKGEPPLTSFSTIGHIIHLNIKEHLLDYKKVIAEVLLDKVRNAKTVVYKKNIINNVYRNFEMEILCGEPNFLTSVIEYGVKFEFDFSKVYWNPRLSTEHDRIVSLLASQDALFDVFAGVGPFAVRAAKKRCLVFANDLNPDSYKWLNHNVKLNKKCVGHITTFNKDGGDFIMSDTKENLLKIWKDKYFLGNIHIVMNLPALALTFLKYFKGLVSESDLANVDINRIKNCLPIVHCYFFVKEPEQKQAVFERDSEFKYDETIHKFHQVRSVSTGKDMYRVTFEMPFEIMVVGNADGPASKRLCRE
ncbi:hypothetical protein RUM44_003175 [Polyplax serrata]|uniref:tRNA (guanine(37)-N1)-methyltransferase n=1 Tax=Polyplax serrata TaxID=468196 RepID=A0ABR1AXR5_POLSC